MTSIRWIDKKVERPKEVETAFIFEQNREYTISEIYDLCESIKQSDNKEYLYADTPEREYVFEKSGDNWMLHHSWFHAFLGKKI